MLHNEPADQGSHDYGKLKIFGQPARTVASGKTDGAAARGQLAPVFRFSILAYQYRRGTAASPRILRGTARGTAASPRILCGTARGTAPSARILRGTILHGTAASRISHGTVFGHCFE